MSEWQEAHEAPEVTISVLREKAADIAALIAASRHRPHPQALVRYVVRAIYRELRGAGLQPEDLIDVAHVILTEVCQDFAHENASLQEAREAELQEAYQAELERSLSEPAHAIRAEREVGDRVDP